MIVFITCNPYNLKKPYPKIEFDDNTGVKEAIDRYSSLWLAQEEPLSESLLPHGDWEGLFPVMVSAWDVMEAQICFVGSKEDYCRLSAACEDYMNANPEFRPKIIADEDLIDDISPANRRKFLLSVYEQWKEAALPEEVALPELAKFNEAWKNSAEILRNKTIIDSEAIVKAQEILSIFLQADAVSEQLENKIYELCSRRMLYEYGMQITLQEAFSRVNVLRKFTALLAKKLKDIVPSVKEILKQVPPPQHTECTDIEINGMMKHWVEDIYAVSFMENFKDRAVNYYYEVCSLCIKGLQNNVHRISAGFHDPLIDDFVASLQKLSYGGEPVLDVKLVRCKETYYRPSYWEGNEARTCSRSYIDLFAYEDDVVSVLKNKFHEDTKLLNTGVEKIINALNFKIKEYEDILNKIKRFEALKNLIDKLKKIVPEFTSINAVIRR